MWRLPLTRTASETRIGLLAADFYVRHRGLGLRRSHEFLWQTPSYAFFFNANDIANESLRLHRFRPSASIANDGAMTVAASRTLPSSTAGLPKFKNPPVSEVALSLQFDTLPGLQLHHLGLLWTKYRDRFPKEESHPPIERAVEVFQREPVVRPAVTFELVSPSMTPRVWFVSDAGSELLQIQRDRFIVNWRRVNPDDKYPHYEHIRDLMEREFSTFAAFVLEHKLGDIVCNQCEVTYINQIQTCDVWDRHAQVGKVLNVMAPEFKEEKLPTPELFRFSAQYIMGQADTPIGRLYLEFLPIFRASDRKPIFAMNLTARGKPLGEGFAGALEFLDAGRSNIVRGFRSLTTPDMHKEWGLNE